MCCHCDHTRQMPDGPGPSQDENKREKPANPDGGPPKVPAQDDDPKKTPEGEDGKAPAAPKTPPPKGEKTNNSNSQPEAPPKKPDKPTNADIDKYGTTPSAEIKAMFPGMELRVYNNDVYARTADGGWTRIGSYDANKVFYLDKNQSPENLGFKKIVLGEKSVDQFPEAYDSNSVYKAPDGSIYERLPDGSWRYLGHVDWTGKRDK